MKPIIKIAVASLCILSSAFTATAQQIKHAKQVTAPVSGNCDMCATTIEKAGSQKQVAMVQWNKDQHIATITYDSTRTSSEAVLKKIALAGYDNASFRAPDEVYASLPQCCQYERAIVTTPEHTSGTAHEMPAAQQKELAAEQQSPLQVVLDQYFGLKDALVQSDATGAQTQALALNKAIGAMNMHDLKETQHTAWMQVYERLSTQSKQISATKDLAKQRRLFMQLSQDIYVLARAMNLKQPLYFQFCPMYNEGKGAHWLSKEQAIQNPYYGSQMLSCGRVQETLK